ncbi:MAG: DUF932 domain-containing protein [Alistipes sp.]|jgi:hypothetical protein|nr:DUF932 domain-containing protein [Alistipes sp.]
MNEAISNMTEPMPQRQAFDFQNNRVEVMNLDTLKRTHQEDGPDGNPMRDIYHFDAIERTMDLCRHHNLNYALEEIFAAQNNSRHQPGVAVLKKQEAHYGEKAVEAHILRRIFTTIRIRDFETDELTTTLVLTYHQDGMQAAIGPCVRMCHNQCILSPERTVATYGRNKVSFEAFFATIDGWLSGFEVQMTADRERILRMKNTPVTEQDIYMYVGLLTVLRVAHDSSDRRLSSRVGTYPLNQTQINSFTEDVLVKMQEKPVLTAWNLYNIATEYYKPERAEIPTLVPQNLAFADTLERFIAFRQPQQMAVPERLSA